MQTLRQAGLILDLAYCRAICNMKPHFDNAAALCLRHLHNLAGHLEILD